jgi:hypothetical protein
MMKVLIPALLISGAASAAGAAEPRAAPAAQTMTCPIGGAAFEYRPAAPAAGLGERPDGKPYGAGAWPMPLPECPGNGLVLYKDYSPQEVAKLEPLVASEAYQALRKEDSQYYRAYWLMKQMGLGPEDYLWVLLQASWQVEDRPDVRKRYLTELAAESAKAPARPADLNWIGMEGRAVNALRELGRFEEAQARLDKVPTKPLDVAAPTPGDQGAAAKQARVRRAWLRYFEQMRIVVARKDSSLEPFELLPRSIALGRCLGDSSGLAEAQATFCAGEQAAVEQLRAARTKEAQELEALRKSREESGR